MTVSVCMIVKDEIDLLSQALVSVKGLADEVIIVDTGSSDGTIALARELGAIVIEGGDRMHKGQSRNQAQDAASGDWIVVLDADEIIVDPEGLRAFLEMTDARLVYVRLVVLDSNDVEVRGYHQMRCWRNGLVRYHYRAHEVPLPVDGDHSRSEYSDFVYEHRPPSERLGWKKDYTLARLEMDVAENPTSGRSLFYLARQHMYMGNDGDALAAFDRYFSVTSESEYNRVDAWRFWGLCWLRQGRWEKCIEGLHRAMAIQPDRRELWGEIAEVYHNRGQHSVARAYMYGAFEAGPPKTAYKEARWYGAHAQDLMARILWKQREYERGLPFAERAVEMSPGNRRLRKNLLFFEDVLFSGNGRDEQGGLKLPDADLRVVFLAKRDDAGVAHRYMRAINSLDGCAARATKSEASVFCYPRDIFRPSDDELEELLDWADVFHIFDDWPRGAVLGRGKPVVVTYNGSYYRQNWERLNESDAKEGIHQLCTTLDLTRYGARWVPIPMEAQQLHRERGNGVFRVAHCPTDRVKKGTDRVLGLRSLDGVELDVIEDVSNRECLQRKAKANLLVDQFELGYGVNALEAWALELPVVSDASDEITALIEESVGCIPFYRAGDDLCVSVEALRSDSALYAQYRDNGRAYLLNFHSFAGVANELRGVYGEL
jgi:glycosyltransferase involved in cell wall biosynthesis